MTQSNSQKLRALVDLLTYMSDEGWIVDLFVRHAMRSLGVLRNLGQYLVLVVGGHDRIAIRSNVPAVKLFGHRASSMERTDSCRRAYLQV